MSGFRCTVDKLELQEERIEELEEELAEVKEELEQLKETYSTEIDNRDYEIVKLNEFIKRLIGSSGGIDWPM